MDKELMDALEADGEKLRQMTGEDHGPHGVDAAPDLKDACNGLLGLLQLICARDDVSPALRHILMDNHRVDEARAALAKAEGAGQ